MKHLTILIPAGQNNLSSITGAYEILTRANQYWQSKGHESLFEIQLAGNSHEVDFNGGLFTVKPHISIQSVRQTDLIIIPSLNHQYLMAIKENEMWREWLLMQYKNGAEIASICTGAFLLASTGLLDGKRCSTHWSLTDIFRQMFPKVILQPDQLMTDEAGLYTNGGAYSFLNLMIYLIEKYYDRATAIYCSKVFQIEIDRNTQSQFSIFTGQKLHNDEQVLLAQAYLEQNLNEKMSVEELSLKFNIGRRNFDRRFIKATGNTPVEYVQRLKIESAKKSFETNRKTIREVMFDVGYSDMKAFRAVFRKYTGLSPIQYKARYYKESLMVSQTKN